MIQDFVEVSRRWRLVHLVGISGLRARYARSRLGQFWLTISNFLLIMCAGLVWSLIWRMDIREYLPYVACGHIVYQFVAATVNESSTALTSDSRVYINEKTPFLLSTAAHVYRQGLILAHNIPIIFVVWIWLQSFTPQIGPAFVLGAGATLAFLVFSSYALSLICARFRDLIQLVGATMQVMFLVTPVMWQVSFLPEQYRSYLLILNPFASMLEVLRNPILGMPVDSIAYLALACWIGIAVVIAAFAHKTWGRSIIFWL